MKSKLCPTKKKAKRSFWSACTLTAPSSVSQVQLLSGGPCATCKGSTGLTPESRFAQPPPTWELDYER